MEEDQDNSILEARSVSFQLRLDLRLICGKKTQMRETLSVSPASGKWHDQPQTRPVIVVSMYNPGALRQSDDRVTWTHRGHTSE